MKHDPFGNLINWWHVMEIFDELLDKGSLSECQPRLIRILRYKGNWRLREQVLKSIGKIQNPTDDLINQVLLILDDDTAYYDVRILAGNALAMLLQNAEVDDGCKVCRQVQKVVQKLKSAPQPPFFQKTINQLYSMLDVPVALEN